MNDNIVAQLHRSLVDALRRSRPGSLHKPVTVAEIYQDLVPYRTARAEVGFEMNADYEHTLLRLLAGEGDLARIEPREVRDKLRMELESPNPDVGLFRNYAACDVWVSVSNDEGAEDEAEDSDAEDEAAESWEEEFVGPAAAASAPANPRAIQEALGMPFEIAPYAEADEAELDEEDEEDEDEIEAEYSAADLADEPLEDEEEFLDSTVAHGSSMGADTETSSCGFCGGELPAGRMVNFCPFCGTDQSQQPCPSCGEMLDPLWRFCIACGARVRPLGDHVN